MKTNQNLWKKITCVIKDLSPFILWFHCHCYFTNLLRGVTNLPQEVKPPIYSTLDGWNENLSFKSFETFKIQQRFYKKLNVKSNQKSSYSEVESTVGRTN